MRKVVFIKMPGTIQKLMLYEYSGGVYLFGYDCLNDTSSVWDMHYDSVIESLEYCDETFGINDDDWIEISEPEPDCQHDAILPTKRQHVNGQNSNNNQYQSFIAGKWINSSILNTKEHSLNGLTGNERLFLTGLIDEFDKAILNDKIKAQKIRSALNIDN
jgi:hypothetical protein